VTKTFKKLAVKMPSTLTYFSTGPCIRAKITVKRLKVESNRTGYQQWQRHWCVRVMLACLQTRLYSVNIMVSVAVAVIVVRRANKTG